MQRLAATIAIGFVSGVLSGMFGIGGGVLTTPAIRLLLGMPALVAVGTPLVAIIPSAVSGSFQYWRKGLTDVRASLVLGAVGAVTAVAGARLTVYAGGTIVLLATAALLLYMAVDMILHISRTNGGDAEPRVESVQGASGSSAPTSIARLMAAGAVAGLYSGFLGLGGGFVLVPLLTRWLRYPVKRAIATSLTAIALLAIPGTITHSLLGNIDWRIGFALVIGVVPGAALGARTAIASSDTRLRIGFAALLVVAGLVLGWTELAVMGR